MGQIMKFFINPFQNHSLCFAFGSSLPQCVLKGLDKTLDYPGGSKRLSLHLIPLWQTQAPLLHHVSVQKHLHQEHRTSLRVQGMVYFSHPELRVSVLPQVFFFFSEQHLLTKQIRGWTGRAGAEAGQGLRGRVDEW